MQRAALRGVGLDGWRYQRCRCRRSCSTRPSARCRRAGFAGANVTIPHKEAALALADSATPLARTIGAANTLTFAADGIAADNTDAPGLLAAIGEPPASALVLGAGGSARAAVHALARRGCDVSVLARTPSRAEGLPATVVDRAGRGAGARQLHARRPRRSRRVADGPGGLRAGRRPRLPGGRHRAHARRDWPRGGRTRDSGASGRAVLCALDRASGALEIMREAVHNL